MDTRNPSYDESRIDAVARGMLQRYSRPSVAREMALDHSNDYLDYRRDYWRAVARRIAVLSATNGDR